MIVWILSIAVALILLIMLGLALFTAWTAHQVETNMPPRGKFIDIDGVRLHYIDKGNGPPLVLIHGLAGQVLNFSRGDPPKPRTAPSSVAGSPCRGRAR